MKARPVGSTARYCPGKPRMTPTFPNVSWWIFSNELFSLLNRSTTILPLSEPMRMKSVSFPMPHIRLVKNTRQAERLQGADETVDLVAADNVDVARLVRSPQFNDVPSRNDKLVHFRRTEIP